MRRFEQEEDGTTKFWQIEMKGDTFVAAWGKVGSNSKSQRTRKFSSVAEAEKEADKQMREKLAAGFSEIGGDGGAAGDEDGAGGEEEAVVPKPKAKAAPVAAAAPATTVKAPRPEKVEKPRPVELPPRLAVRPAEPEAVASAATALRDLEATLGKRSWRVAQKTQRARRALEEVAGIDPSSDRGLAAAFDALMARVVGGAPRLPLRLAMALLEELDSAAFTRALEIWQRGQATPAAQLLVDQAELLEHPELALRVGALLVDRPRVEAGWSRRWQTLSPLLEGQLKFLQTTLPRYLDGIDAAGDEHLARRVERMKA